jgi:hypothetical protein
MAHSLVEDDKGRRFDLTAYTGQPFLEFEGIEEEFVLLVSARQLAHVDRRRQLALADALEIFGVLPHLVA